MNKGNGTAPVVAVILPDRQEALMEAMMRHPSVVSKQLGNVVRLADWRR